MTNLQRITGKIFGETATATGDDPQIGQFGSALAGTYVGTTDVSTIQNLAAWSNGFIDSVTPDTQFPPLPEMTGFGKVLSYQTAYTLQKGVPEYDLGTTYYSGDMCKAIGEGKIFVSKIDNNINNPLTDTTRWEEAFANIDLSNLSSTSSPNFDGDIVGVQQTTGRIANEVSMTTSDKTYDISAILPNDNYNYEVWLKGIVITGSTSGNRIYLAVNSDILGGLEICRTTTRTTSTVSAAGFCLLPIGQAREITVSGNTGANGIYTLDIMGYRRLGTNS